MSGTYTAVAFERFGEPGEVLAVREIERPALQAGQVRLGVEAVGLNYLDATFIRGGYPVRPPFPAVAGVEATGVVIEAGEGAEQWLGKSVIACPMMPAGALGQEAVVDASLIVERPAGIDIFDAAALPVTYQTAWWAFERGRLAEGETVLISAGAGGVGTAATQLAKGRGARVVTIVGGAEKAALSRAQGADIVIDRLAGGVREQLAAAVDSVDVVVDSVGAEIADIAIDALAFGGRFVAVGQTAGATVIDVTRFCLKNIDFIGLSWGSMYPFVAPGPVAATYAELFADLEAGRISPVISSVVELAEVPRALDELAAGRTTGKIIVNVGTPTGGAA